MKGFTWFGVRRWVVLMGLIAGLVPAATSASSGSFIGPLNTVSMAASTVPSNGDLNPYGVAQNITVANVTDDFVSPVPGSSFRQDSRTFPSFSIAPNGTLYVVWANRTGDPTNGHAKVMLTKSTNGGLTWSAPVLAGNVPGRSAFFASVAADPNNNVDVAFNAMDDVPTGTAPGAGVVHYDTYLTRSTNGGASFSSPLLISTATSDPDGSSTNSLGAQFLGDYITAVADTAHVYAVWTDSRNATPCAAVDAFRAHTGPKPDVITQCPITFGNTDIFLGTVTP